jgi:hypothetical protein
MATITFQDSGYFGFDQSAPVTPSFISEKDFS